MSVALSELWKNLGTSRAVLGPRQRIWRRLIYEGPDRFLWVNSEKLSTWVDPKRRKSVMEFGFYTLRVSHIFIPQGEQWS